MPQGRLNQKTKRFREALREARVSGRPVDDVFGQSELAYERALRLSFDRSNEMEAISALAHEHAQAIVEGPSALSRREFLRRAAVLGAVGATATVAPMRRASVAEPRVVVVGAGFAGLTACSSTDSPGRSRAAPATRSAIW